MPYRHFGIAIAAVWITAISTAQAADPALAGLAYVQANCAVCHATGRSGASPNPDAPAFRILHEHYDVEGLAETLAEGIVVGHRGLRQMPRFVLNPAQIDAVIAYLKSLERPQPPYTSS